MGCESRFQFLNALWVDIVYYDFYSVLSGTASANMRFRQIGEVALLVPGQSVYPT